MVSVTLKAGVARWAWLPAVVILAGGCGQEYVNFMPAVSPQAAAPGWVAKGQYRLPPGVGAVTVDLSARGEIVRGKQDVEAEEVDIHVTIRNRGPSAFTLDPAAVRLVDDEGRAVFGATGYRGKAETGAIQVAGGANDAVVLVFQLPPNIRFATMGSFQFIWPCRYGDRAFETRTKFIKVEDVYYNYPGYSYPGYYYPYYYPYHYGYEWWY
jgi:hypothetical protein